MRVHKVGTRIILSHNFGIMCSIPPQDLNSWLRMASRGFQRIEFSYFRLVWDIYEGFWQITASLSTILHPSKNTLLQARCTLHLLGQTQISFTSFYWKQVILSAAEFTQPKFLWFSVLCLPIQGVSFLPVQWCHPVSCALGHLRALCCHRAPRLFLWECRTVRLCAFSSTGE